MLYLNQIWTQSWLLILCFPPTFLYLHTSKSKFLQMIIHSMKVHSILQNRRVESNFNKLTEIPFLLYSSMESGIFLIGVFILYILWHSTCTAYHSLSHYKSHQHHKRKYSKLYSIKLRLTLFTLHISYSSSLWKSN